MSIFGANNGRKPPAPIPGGALPIIGQPFEIKGWQFTALLVCKCDGTQHPLLVTNGNFVRCRACGKAYTIQACQFTAGQPPAFNIGVVAKPEDGKPAEPALTT